MKRAVILLSGGLDSATTLAIAKAEGFACYALSFRYGQRHEVELDAAARVAKHLGAKEHRIVDFDLRQFGASALTSDIAVPKNRPLDDTIPAGLTTLTIDREADLGTYTEPNIWLRHA